MIDKERLGERIKEECTLHGDFLLRSGIRSNVYFDKYRVTSNAGLLHLVASGMKDLLPTDREIDLLAGLELGGAMLSTAISMESGIDTVAVRKKAKEYGTEKMIEGIEVRGMNVCVVEDVITSGGAVFDAVRALRAEGATVDDVICLILRRGSTRLLMSEFGLRLTPLFYWETD